MFDRRSLMAGLALAPLWAAAARAQSSPSTTLPGIDVTAPRVKPVTTPYTIEELFRPAPALDADLSEDGSKVALLIDTGAEDARKTELLIFSAEDPSKGEARFTFGETNANWLRWAGSGRVLIGVSGSSPTDLSRRSRDFAHNADRRRELPYRRVMSVPLDGSGSVQLFQPGAGPRLRIPPERFRKVLNLGEVVSVTGADHALMAAFDREELNARFGQNTLSPGRGTSFGLDQFYASRRLDQAPPMSTVSLYRVDLATGEPELVMEGSNRTIRWEAQGGEAVLRRDIAPDGGSEIWMTRPPGQAVWKPVRTVDRANPDIAFLAASDRPRALWVLARAGAETVRSVRLWDIDANSLAEPVSGRANREPVGIQFDPQGGFLLASYRGAQGLEHDSPDASVKTVLATLAVHFGDGAAVRLMHIDAARTRFLVEVSGPQQPRAYYLFDSKRRRLADIGGGARLVPDRLADAEPVELTRPPAFLGGVLTGSLDGRPGPLVVIVQPPADPESLYSFDPMAQLFATRGWWTLRLIDNGEAADTHALAVEAARVAGLDASRMAIFGQGAAGRAALERLAGPYRASVVFDSPEPEDTLLAGLGVGDRKQLALEAMSDGKPVLVIRSWRDARNARQSDRGVAKALLQNDAGGLADAIALGEAGDADWNRLSTQVERARLVADFLERALA